MFHHSEIPGQNPVSIIGTCAYAIYVIFKDTITEHKITVRRDILSTFGVDLYKSRFDLSQNVLLQYIFLL